MCCNRTRFQACNSFSPMLTFERETPRRSTISSALSGRTETKSTA
jgi:hypothetical protein